MFSLVSIRRSFFAGALFLACASLSFAAAAGTITGSVSDASRSPVPGAIVTLNQLAGAAVLNATTDARGRFSLEGVAAGEYLLSAAAQGLSAAETLRLSLAAGERKAVSLELIVSALRTQVTVTAADQPQSLDQVSKALDLVNTDEAERRGLFSVADAVRFVPGLRVATSGGPGALTTIQSRGLPPEDTAILVDGFRLRDPTAPKGDATAQIGDLLLINPARIEVLRGSGSSLYGTNSVAGSVNLLTAPGGGPLHADLDLQGGGLGLFRGVAQVSGSALGDRLAFSGGLTHLNATRGVDSVGAARNWSSQSGVTYAFTPTMRIGATVFTKTGYAQESVSPIPTSTAPLSGITPAIPLTTAEIRLADRSEPYDAGTATFVPSLGDPDARINARFTDSLLRFEHEVNSRLSYRIAYAFVDSVRDNWDGPGGPGFYQPLFDTSTRYIGRIGTLQGRINYLLGSHNILTAGYEFEHESYYNLNTDLNPDAADRAYFRTDARQRSHAAFFEDQVRMLDGRLQLSLAGRFTQASLDTPTYVNAPSSYQSAQLSSPPAAYTGDASLAYFLRRSSTKIRAHVGNSFRLPSLYERFGEYLFDGFSGALGDPRLSPERAISVDAGFDQFLFHDHLKLSGSYFYAHLQQVIGFLSFPPEYIDPFGRYSGYYNTGGGVSRGVELSGEFRPSSKSTVNASYTYTNARDRTSQYFTGTAYDPLQSVRIQPHVLKIVAVQQLPKRFDLSLDFEGGSDFLSPVFGLEAYAYRFPGSRQLGLAAGYTLNPAERIKTRFYLRVSNALDQDYYENGFRTPGRWAVAGFRIMF